MSIILFEVIFMPIPAEILAVERPKGTVVKQSHGRYLVIKRTSKRVNGKPKPVDLGTVGEIINRAYVEIRKEPRRHRNEVDIKDYGEFALCNKACGDLLQELARSFSIQDAKRIFVIAMLRTMDQDIKNRDLQFAYETSYISEIYPGVHLSENTVSDFLEKTGMAYRHIHQFMQSRMDAFGGGHLVIDGMLKDNNSSTNTFSEWSRRGARKGSRDINLIFAYDPETKEPVAVKPYPGNMLDLTALQDFVAEYAITSGILIMDKGFTSNENIGKLREIKDLPEYKLLKVNNPIDLSAAEAEALDRLERMSLEQYEAIFGKPEKYIDVALQEDRWTLINSIDQYQQAQPVNVV